MDVELPDGTVISDIPEGTSKQALVDKLARNGYDTRKLGMTSQAQSYRPADDFAERPGMATEFLGGAKHSWDSAAMGLKDLATKFVGTIPEAIREGGSVKKLWGDSTLSPDEQQLLEQGKAFVHETGPASTVGQIGGDIALSAAPATKVYGGVKAATSVFPKALSMLPSIAAGAVPAAALAPENRLQAAGMGAVGGALGEAGGRIAQKVFTRLVTSSAAARTLMDEGVQPTVGQGAASGGVRVLEDTAGSLPIIGGVVRRGQSRAAGELRQALVNRADPTDLLAAGVEGINSSGLPHQVVAELKRRTTAEWTTALGKVPPVPVTPALRQGLADLTADMPEEVGALFINLISKHLSKKSELTGETLGAIHSDIGKLAHVLSTSERGVDRYAAEAVQEAQKAFNNQFLKGATEHLNDAYRNFLVQQRAAGELGTQAEIAPRVFQRALRNVGGRTQYARGEALASPADVARTPTQDLIDAGQILNVSSTGKASQLGTGAAAVAGSMLHLPATVAAEVAAWLGSTKAGAKFAFGQYPIQQRFADILRQTRGVQAATGAAVAEQNRSKPLNEWR